MRSAAPAEGTTGRPLAEVLRELQDQGLAIVFTSELVGPDMVVAEEPEAREPRRVLDEILAPHGLAVREGPGGVLVVVADGGAAKSSARGGAKDFVGRGIPRHDRPRRPRTRHDIRPTNRWRPR